MSQINKDPWRSAEEYGIDISILRENLNLSVEEKVVRHERALSLRFELEKVRSQVYGKTQSNSENFIRK